MSAYTYPLSGEIQDMNAYSHVVQLTTIDCTPTCTTTILSECGDTWNCRQQSKEKLYFTPVLAGDKIMFQFLFLDRWNTDPEVPEEGWGGWGNQIVAELYDENGETVEPISDDHTLFASRYLVGWDGTQSYQLIEIDFDLLQTNFPNLRCFSFKFIAYGAVEDLVFESDSICSQHFRIEDNDCENTVVIRSIRTADCCGNYYGLPEAWIGNAKFAYDNKWRYFASVRQTNTEFEKQRFGNKRTKVELDRIFILQLRAKIPPYLFRLLSEIHLSGERLFIDDIEYFIDTFTFPNESERDMFIGKIPLFQECDTDYRCN